MTSTGMAICPSRLKTCLTYLYHWLGRKEMWRIFIDGTSMGRDQVTLIGLSNINNSSLLHGLQWNSPSEVWITNLFFLQESRFNLESNIGNDGGNLGEFIDLLQENQHEVFLSADSKCVDAIFGGSLGPTTTDKWNMYMHGDVKSKGDYDRTTGRRSKLGLKIGREHEDKLLNIPLEHVGLDPNHLISRVMEKMLKVLVRDIHQIPSWTLHQQKGSHLRRAALGHLVFNISSRDVHRGKDGLFTLQFEKDQLKDFTLNTSTAEVILAPQEDFVGAEDIGDILQNVLPDDPYHRAIPEDLQQLLTIDKHISHRGLVQTLWKYLWHMYRMISVEPVTLKEGAVEGSQQEADYIFGYNQQQIDNYIDVADKFHRLFLFLYGSDDLTPYMMKLIDVAPQLMQALPFKSLMRLCTESGEHKHYENNCVYYHHTPRGGGRNKPSVLCLILERQWRMLLYRIKEECPEPVYEAFQDHVEETLAADGRAPQRDDGQDDRDKGDDNNDDRPTGIIGHHTPLAGKRFVLCGRLPKKHDVYSTQIKHLGGMVYDKEKLPDERYNLSSWFVITTQAELDRPTFAVKDIILQAFRRKWQFITFEYITECILHRRDVGVETFQLNTVRLEEAPVQSLQALRTLAPTTGRCQR